MSRENFGSTMSRNRQNTKCKGSAIYNIDTFRGCPNKCESCYAKRNSAITIKNFDKAVKVEKFVGKRQDDIWYRIGNSGDPAMNWKYSEKLIRKWEFKQFFIVTKLQSIKGFTGYFDKLQVSVDPLNQKHFLKTLDNVKTLLLNYPHVKIVLRVRSVSTADITILTLQDAAVKFANSYNLPILETRMRFNNGNAFDKYNLIRKDYEWRGSYFRPHHGLRFLVGAKKYYDCDLYGKKCANCANCTSTWVDSQFEKKGEFIAPRKEKYIYPIKEAA